VSSPTIGGAFDDLAERLRDVRIACGDWGRVVTPSVTWRHGLTAVLLDPPYDDEEHAIRYSGGASVSADVRAWAIENGERDDMRIALCGYDGEHDMPASWECVAWKAQGGYGSQGQGRGRDNSDRERVWFSPACLGAEQPSLFSTEVA
jgi:site-specific DNA-adenine methylase